MIFFLCRKTSLLLSGNLVKWNWHWQVDKSQEIGWSQQMLFYPVSYWYKGDSLSLGRFGGKSLHDNSCVWVDIMEIIYYYFCNYWIISPSMKSTRRLESDGSCFPRDSVKCLCSNSRKILHFSWWLPLKRKSKGSVSVQLCYLLLLGVLSCDEINVRLFLVTLA